MPADIIKEEAYTYVGTEMRKCMRRLKVGTRWDKAPFFEPIFRRNVTYEPAPFSHDPPQSLHHQPRYLS